MNKREKKMFDIKKVDILPFQVVKSVGKRKTDIAKNFAIPTKAIRGDDDGFVLIDNKSAHIYTVLPGDTLQSIANKFGTTPLEIKKKNDVLFIFVGQQLLI